MKLVLCISLTLFCLHSCQTAQVLGPVLTEATATVTSQEAQVTKLRESLTQMAASTETDMREQTRAIADYKARLRSTLLWGGR